MGIRLVTLGPPACRIGDRDVADLPAQRTRFAVLTYLAIERNVSRDDAAALFWGDNGEERARHALSQSLYELKRILGEEWLDARSGRLVVTSELTVDALEFLQHTEEGSFDEAVKIYYGSFLSGFFLNNSKGFETWVDRQRAQLERAHRRARRGCVNALVDARRWPEAIQAARQWVEVDPFDDEANHRLIELLSSSGNRAEALHEFSAYEQRLKTELQIEPLEHTRKIIEEIRKAATASSTLESAGAMYAVHPRTTFFPAFAKPAKRARRFAMGTAAALVLISAGMLARRDRNVGLDCKSDVSVDCSALDSLSYVVLPFASSGSSPDGASDGFLFANAITDNLSRIEGVRTFDHMRVIDAVQRVTSDLSVRLPVDSAILLTRRLGARNVILGELQLIHDSIRVVASLYDASDRDATARNVRLRLSRAELLARGPVVIADSLFVKEFGVAGAGAARVSLLGARRFGQGEAALASWRLGVAASHYRAALQLDPDYGFAAYRLAQVMMWQMDTASEWRAVTQQADRLRGQLPETDRDIVRALRLAAIRDYEGARLIYRGVIARDSLNFAAWYGLADCLAFDTKVLPSTQSPSGYAFRTSYNEAIAAYQRALELAPSFNRAFEGFALERLSRMFYTSSTAYRAGFSDASPIKLVAFPLLEKDTLSFVPYEISALPDFGTEEMRASRKAALWNNRNRLRQVVIQWIRANPGSPQAFAALAELNEISGLVRSQDDPDVSALDALEAARRLRPDSASRLHLQAMQARLWVKTRQFKRARAVVDSIYRAHPDPHEDAAFKVAAALALAGKIDRAASVLGGAATLGSAVPGVAVKDIRVSRKLLIYSSFRTPADSVRAIYQRLESQLAMLEPEARSLNRMVLLQRSVALGFPVAGVTPVHQELANTWPLLEMQIQAAHGNNTKVRQSLDRTALESAGDPVEPEIAYAHIGLRLQIGDTLKAIRELDRILEDLTALDERLLVNPSQSAGLVNLMIARAQLAKRTGDRDGARYWARQVLILWSEADHSLNPVVQEMRNLVRRW